MNWYSLTAYLAYRKKALTRHGVHSPFVFDFIEKVLRKRPSSDFRNYLNQHLGAACISWVDELNPANWEQAFVAFAKDCNPNQVIVFPQIYKSAFHTEAWRRLCERPEVSLSIDLYRYGLLFFREEMREKQHFVLLFPA